MPTVKKISFFFCCFSLERGPISANSDWSKSLLIGSLMSEKQSYDFCLNFWRLSASIASTTMRTRSRDPERTPGIYKFGCLGSISNYLLLQILDRDGSENSSEEAQS
jgi:hypothetical protein